MKKPTFTRHPENPIVVPGLYPWRRATVFNPGALYDEGRFYLYERTAGQLRPFHCSIGMLESDDGVHFTHTRDQPVWTPEMAGSKYGSVQDARLARFDDTYYMTYAFRPYAWESHPTGVGVPQSYEVDYPGFEGRSEENQTRSGIAVSSDRVNWEHLAWATPKEIDDRDVILFPEKIDGRYVLLRRPLQFVNPDHTAIQAVDAGPRGTRGGIWMSFSKDLHTWTEPELLIRPEQPWEGGRIGGATPPIKTEAGWLVFYHGVETEDPSVRRVCYRLGAMLLDLEDPRTVIARCPDFLMEPEAYYERFGLYIPNVIFPTGNVVVDGLIYLYYGCCDTAIGLATVPLEDVVTYVMGHKT